MRSGRPDTGGGPDLVIRAGSAVLPGGTRPATVRISDGKIIEVGPYHAARGADEAVVLGDDEVLLPGLVDSHVHVNEPGRTDWEGFATATRAAAAGGITTIVDMPLNSIPPTIDAAALRAKREAAAGQVHVDVGFWGGAVPGNPGQLPELHGAGRSDSRFSWLTQACPSSRRWTRRDWTAPCGWPPSSAAW